MDNLIVKFSSYAKAVPPQPIRMTNGGWAGSPEKMEDGSEPQPWHCLPFVEASTYGLELVYPYETECHVVSANGTIRFDWDFANEPGGGVTGGEFRAFSPVEASKYYLFNTRLTLLPPLGYVVRTEPHPRYFTDDTGTVPLPMIGHWPNEGYPQMVMVVFRAPPPGQRHIFREGEPFAQVIFVPQRTKYTVAKMSVEQAAQRLELEHAMEASRLDIAEHVWRNPGGFAFNNHYKVLARAFARDGLAGVKEVVKEAVEAKEKALRTKQTIPECLALGSQRIREQKFEQAVEIFTHVLNLDPNNAGAHSALGVCFSSLGNVTNALRAMTQAVALQPGSPNYHTNLGELLRRQGRLQEAEASFRSAIFINPSDPEVLSLLGLTLAQQGRLPEALEVYRAAVATGSALPPAHLGMGLVLAQQGHYDEARKCYEAALAIAPNFIAARQALGELPKTSQPADQ